MTTRWIFDANHYELLNSSRAASLMEALKEVRKQQALRDALDVGCGLGYFSNFLTLQNLEVQAVDGRLENVTEAKKRFPHVRFSCCNAEDSALKSLGVFDLVLCFGLLYHLENPFLTIRHLRAVTSKLLLIEGVIFPGDDPVMALVDETASEDQALGHVAFYPTEMCLIKMLYRAGFRNVYSFARQPNHPDFQASMEIRRARTILAASDEDLVSTLFVKRAETSVAIAPWDPRSDPVSQRAVDKLRRFMKKPFPEKVSALKGGLARESK